MANQAAGSTARVGGSGFTWFQFRGTAMGYAQALGYTSPQPVAQPVAVQPLNYVRPVEVVTPRAIGNGTLTVQFIDHWNLPVWSRLGFNANDLADVFAGQWQHDQGDLHGSVIVRGPQGGAKKRLLIRHFIGLKVVDIRDDETVDITTMLLNKPVTFWYRKSFFTQSTGDKAKHLYAGVPDVGNSQDVDTAADRVVVAPTGD